MALEIRRDASIKVRVISTLVMAFALVVQPMYGFVSSQVVNAATANVTQLRVSPINPSANAGVAGELKLELRNANNTNESLDSEATVVLSSDSITGQFAKGLTTNNPWEASPTYILEGGVATMSFRYKDATVDKHTITATVAGGGLASPLSTTREFVVNAQTQIAETGPVMNITTGKYFNSIQAALNDNATLDGHVVKLLEDVMTGAQTTIKKAVTIDGNGFALSPNFIKSGNDNNATISVIGASNVTIRNLTINGTLFGNLHGINIYESSNVQLHGIVLNNNNAGVIVNSSTVFIENITTAGNRWYAVNVDQKTSQAASLTISGVSSHAEVDKPHVFIDNTNKVVAFIDAEGQYAMRNGVLYPNDAAYTLNMLVDPNNQNVQRFSGDVYRDIALDNCDGLDECKNQRTGDMLADWEMRLYKEDTNGAWQSVRSAVTDGNGKYNLGAAEEAGVYHVCEVLKAGWTQPIQTWNGSGYLVNTPNASGVADEGKYCTTTNYTDEKDNSSVSHFGNVDVSAPVVSNISISPRATNGNIGGTVTVTFDLNDAHPINIAKTRVLFSDGPSDANRARESVQNPVLVAGNTYKAVFNTKSFVKNGYTGNYNLGFNPYDSLGNQTSSKPASFRNILIDNTGPSIGNKTPVQNERIGGTYKVSATVTDQSGVDDSSIYARFRDDAGKEYTHYLTREGVTNVYSKLVDTRTIINKATSQPNRVSFAAEDVFGTSRSSVSDGVVIDNNNPVIQSAALSDTLIDTNDNNPTLNAGINGTGSDVKNVQYRIHTKAGLEVGGYSWVEVGAKDGIYDSEAEQAEGVVNINGLADGEYVARIRAFDAIGNKKSGIDVAFVIDRTAPVASITSHNDGDTISGQVTLVGQVDDANPMNTHFKITGPDKYVKTATKKDGTREHALAWDVSSLPNGTYTVQFETRDQAGNKTSASTKKITLVVDNPQPIVNGANFNTHSGADYKGINVGFNLEAFKTVTSVTVDLYDAEGTLLASNTHNQALLDLITGGVKQLSTPFITDAGTYIEEYWNTNARTWTAADKPARAKVTVTGTNNAGVTVTEDDELTSLAEPNGWTYESVLPVAVFVPGPVDGDTNEQPNGSNNGSQAGGGEQAAGSENANSVSFVTGSTFSPLQTPASIFFAQVNGNEGDAITEDDDTAVLGTQSENNNNSDVKGTSDTVAAIEATDEGWKFLGVSWYWLVLLVVALGSAWYLLARRRNQDA